MIRRITRSKWCAAAHPAVFRFFVATSLPKPAMAAGTYRPIALEMSTPSGSTVTTGTGGLAPFSRATADPLSPKVQDGWQALVVIGVAISAGRLGVGAGTSALFNQLGTAGGECGGTGGSDLPPPLSCNSRCSVPQGKEVEITFGYSWPVEAWMKHEPTDGGGGVGGEGAGSDGKKQKTG